MTVYRGLQVIRREGTSRVILYAPWAILHQRRVGHRWAGDTIKSIITPDFTGRITFRQVHPSDLFMADPPVTARSPRKFVFDEFS